MQERRVMPGSTEPVRAGVTTAALGVAGAAPDGPDVLVLNEDADGPEPPGEVAPHGGEDDEHLRLADGVEAQVDVRADLKGPDIEGGAGDGGGPLLVQRHQLEEGAQKEVGVKVGQLDALGAVPHPLHVVHGAEELDGAVLGAVGLEALKDLRAVVEHGGAGVDAEVVQGDDFRVVPAALRVVVHGEHVVGEYRAEAQLGGVGGLGAGGGGAGNLDIHCLSLPCFPIFPVRHSLSVDDRDVPFYYRPVHRP